MNDKYTLNIDLNVLNHLGLNLYSNVPAVLSEIIANAWDADSKKVDIEIDKESQQIVITDNGCGMDVDDLNSKFLTVGYQRRENTDLNLKDKTVGGRPVMGRKGIGKLSIFSIAEEIEIYTKKSGTKTIGISMKVFDIKRKIESGTKEPYHPPEKSVDGNNEIVTDSGTKIVLKQIKKRVNTSIDENLKKRVARRFDVWSDKFSVTINKEKIGIEDRDYFHKLEFIATYGSYAQLKTSSIDDDKIKKQPNDIEGHQISGWIGLAKNSGDLKKGGDNLNKITVLSRGKVALENILDLYREAGLYAQYLIGEIRADFLDSTDLDDIATSDRQDFIQSDPRFIKLKDFIGSQLKFMEQERAAYKQVEGVKAASEIPAIRNWLKELKGDTKKSAEKLLGKINSIATDDNLKTLYSHSVLAFEYLKHKEQLQQLELLDLSNLETTVKLFSELDDIEASWYHQITKGRLDVINKLADITAENALERVIQEHIYDHLWLLDPSWDRATEHPQMEKSIKDELGKLNLTPEEKQGRIDIRYKKVSGKNIIIELKRSSVRPSFGELTDQVDKYRGAVQKELDSRQDKNPIEIICLLGGKLSGWESNAVKEEQDIEALEKKGIRVMTYKKLIDDSQILYKEYLAKDQERGRIQELLDEISMA